MSDPNIGRFLGKRYQLQELIGTGAMGRVYRAKDILLGGVPVAVKFLALSLQNKKMQLQERFEREAKTCALLGQKSIHIVRVMDYGVDENETPYYVMEYLQGQSLTRIIRQQNQNLSFPRFLSMARQICLGLKCAHDGIPVDGAVYPIIHRDIKPSNMLVIQDPSFGELVKVLDFGIAKLLQADIDQTKYYLGTMAYSSPEQMKGKELDNRADIYSLGVMMFEMLTGKMPLVAPTHSFKAWYKTHHLEEPRTFATVAPTLQIPQSAQDLVMSCLAKAASDRPQSIGEILEVLESLEQDDLQQTSSPDDHAATQALAIRDELEPKKIANLPVSLPKEKLDQVHNATWPTNKPIADIVFPKSIQSNGEMVPALWVMLPQPEINKRLSCNLYNQFLFITTPHPMLLWITVIYNRQHGAKFLPYYLDMKTSLGQEIAGLLAQKGSYRLLLFAREVPDRCSHVLISSIDPAQPQRLQQWIAMSKSFASSANPHLSKNLLKSEYEKIKPTILTKLETSTTDMSLNISR
ncbi:MULTISPECIES: serine/threonine-protein kinase [unclassified Nodularia (in: cyanobacteria)]|uniref:serine/threonine protein kinase n=1 Tax=unclassified Nodularia (in: cyanobacteria) TaxID=2656917 RepID=UPI00187F55F9|nr:MULTISPECIES: serine/threonine-protein kinase [unclassified Nodularia (in: cyanobacteria)]MBE9201374.1 serine/threonine protein kinase [Nodularia sp. LEGE 06071]MCC2694639.1 serine/threonine protein kinase [Nodularia sp. LEGE 04288]